MIRPIWLCGLALWAGALVAHAQEASLFTKSRWFVQSSAAAPTQAAESPFRVSYFGENLGVASPSATLVLPSGATRDTAKSGPDRVFSDSAASAAALNLTYGAGSYTLRLEVFSFTASGTATLGADDYPAAPQITNLAEAQAVDPENEFLLRASPLVNPGPDDYLRVLIRSAAGIEVFSGYFYGSEAVEFSLAAQTLAANQTYSAELWSTHIVGREGEDDLQPLAVGFASVTQFTLHTTGAGGPADTTPPSVTQTSPAGGGALTNVFQSFVVQFSEPMDTARQPMAFTATKAGAAFALNEANFITLWDDSGTVLTTLYSPVAGGWPANLVVSWTLAGGSDGFRDRAGNPLAATTGTFQTSQGASGDGCPGSSTVEAAGFGLFKLVNYVQSAAGAPENALTNAALVQAFARVTDPPGRAALEFPADPAPKPHSLKFFSQITGTELFTESFPARSDLDAVYPAGQYDFQFRDRAQPTVVKAHVVLTLSATGYPPIPHFSGFAAAQNIGANSGFTLAWDAFAGAVVGTDSLSLTVEDEEGNTVLSLPDACHDRPLAVTATSVEVPQGLLVAGKTYVATLSFFRVNDHDQTLPGTTAKGVAAVGRATRMTLKVAGGTVIPPLIRTLALKSATELELTIESTVGRAFTLEQAASLGGTFSPTLTTNPPVSPFTLVVPAGASGFFRGRVD